MVSYIHDLLLKYLHLNGKQFCLCPCLDLQRRENGQGASVCIISEFSAYGLIEFDDGLRRRMEGECQGINSTMDSLLLLPCR